MDKLQKIIINLDYEIGSMNERLDLWFRVEELSLELEDLKNAQTTNNTRA